MSDTHERTPQHVLAQAKRHPRRRRGPAGPRSADRGARAATRCSARRSCRRSPRASTTSSSAWAASGAPSASSGRRPGVYTTAVGYAGGSTPNPTYREVCSGMTGHTEVVLVAYDPAKISTEQILRMFWEGHDPTQGMRQGNDHGTQYRSAIYWHTPEQRDLALATRDAYAEALRDARPRRDHDRDRRGRPVLPGRGLPPAVPAEEPGRLLRHRRHGRLLPDRRRRQRLVVFGDCPRCSGTVRVPFSPTGCRRTGRSRAAPGWCCRRPRRTPGR